MNVTIVSQSWPSDQRSGVSLAAAKHVEILAAEGHRVSIVGGHSTIRAEALPVVAIDCVPAHGSGALYSPARLSSYTLARALHRQRPDILVVEAWQTALTDRAVDVGWSLGIPVLMVSHGVSLHPFSRRLADFVRSLGWVQYRLLALPRRIQKLSALTTLDEASSSPRFYDRDLAHRLGVSVVSLVNAPINWAQGVADPSRRKRQVLVVGYFSAVKNQMQALAVAAGCNPDLKFIFVGPRNGKYYEACQREVARAGLGHRTSFLQDNECCLAEALAQSLIVLSTSRTEVLPIVLLEAMASGTPFVATAVGAVPSLRGGILAGSTLEQIATITSISSNDDLWRRLSEAGRTHYAREYSSEHVRHGLAGALSEALRVGAPNRAKRDFADTLSQL